MFETDPLNGIVLSATITVSAFRKLYRVRWHQRTQRGELQFQIASRAINFLCFSQHDFQCMLRFVQYYFHFWDMGNSIWSRTLELQAFLRMTSFEGNIGLQKNSFFSGLRECMHKRHEARDLHSAGKRTLAVNSRHFRWEYPSCSPAGITTRTLVFEMFTIVITWITIYTIPSEQKAKVTFSLFGVECVRLEEKKKGSLCQQKAFTFCWDNTPQVN